VRKTSRYIDGHLDGRTALHLSFLPGGRSHVFPITPEPLIYHSPSVIFGVLTCYISLFRGYLDSSRVNDRNPLLALNTHSKGVSNSSVFHSRELCAELKSAQERSKPEAVGGLVEFTGFDPLAACGSQRECNGETQQVPTRAHSAMIPRPGAQLP
jgi:hypothetical protein